MNSMRNIWRGIQRIVLGLSLGLALSAPIHANQTTSDQAQTATEQPDASEQITHAASNAELNDLIALLESETARQAFIDKLKALAQLQQEEEQDQLALSELLHLEDSSGALATEYSQLLQNLGLSDSEIGKILVSIGALFSLMLMALANRWIARTADRKLNQVRSRFALEPDRLRMITQVWSLAGFALCLTLGIAAIAEIWQLGWFLPEGQASYLKLLNWVLTLGVLALLYAVFWEVSNAAIEYGMRHARSMSSARADTVLPIIRRVIFIVLVIIFTLMTLSELGINIMPLVAGAGVFGIAIGFGAQTVVRDFLVGFIIVLEDLLQIGDVVKVAGRMGEVEKITMRKLQLRSLDGTVHTIPFSELDVVENHTKEYSYYLTDIGVAYKEDIDSVIACAKDVSKSLREDDTFGPMMLDDIEILGVNQFADSAVNIRVRLKTRAHDKWALGREFNRRIKYAFDERGIEIPFPHRTFMLGESIGDKINPTTTQAGNDTQLSPAPATTKTQEAKAKNEESKKAEQEEAPA
ncbi:mechanosensitive ion channel family protein [Simiduia sp. 21SJ11W-1]|uniref:mechanosensitive ion channel family protein n=1 Tax=Simiduia sp. 21SJ11W-1 TaxID=2909669 RepID=UPI00209EAE6B|nr:mechanosensitive ion channel family protein [Simiduia sp. 21SJ11W-1]UTA48510.1 mechanosensitive ion channel family protein [Simiduia sp. 21SJ11W-1]